MTLRPLRHAAIAGLEFLVIVVREARQDFDHYRADFQATFREDGTNNLLAKHTLPGLRQVASPDGDSVFVGFLIPCAAVLLDSSQLSTKLVQASRNFLCLPRMRRAA